MVVSSGRAWKEPELHFRYGVRTGGHRQKLELKPHGIFYDFPDYEGYPASFFPVVTFRCRNHDDHYDWEKDTFKGGGAARKIRWKRASKPAEMVALLLAMAQQQVRRLMGERAGQDVCCPGGICVSCWPQPSSSPLSLPRVLLANLHMDIE